MRNLKCKRLRNTNYFFVFAFLLKFLLFSTNGFGQDSKFSPLKQALNQYGKISNHISDIVVDKRGRIWLGTLNGLMLYDGFKTTIYRIPNVLSGHFQTNTISKLCLQNDSLLWIVNTQGICTFNTNTFRFKGYEIPKTQSTQALNSYFVFSDNRNNLWVSWQDLGLLIFDKPTNKFVFPKDSLLKSKQAVKSVQPWGKQHLIFSHRDGVSVYNIKLKKTEAIHLPKNPFHYFKEEVFSKRISSVMPTDEHIFVAGRYPGETFYSIFKYNIASKDTTVLDLDTPLSPYFFKDSKSNVWVYGVGLNVIEAFTGKLHRLETDKNYGFSLCNSVYEDEERNIWFCTNEGLFYYNLDEIVLSNLMLQIKEDHTFQLNGDILPIRDGGVWVGTYNDGILTFGKDLQFAGIITFPESPGNSNNIICSLYQDWNGVIWIGTLFGNLIRYDLATKKYEIYNDTLLNQSKITSITGSKNHGLLVANQNGGIFSFSAKEKRFTVLNNEKSKKNRMDFIMKIDLYGDSLLLVCTLNSGFFTHNLNTGVQVNYTMNPLKKGAPLTDLFIDLKVLDSIVYVSTGSGLVEFDPIEGSFKPLLSDENLPFSECYIMASTGKDELYVSTSDGIYQINLSNRLYSKIGRGTVAEKSSYNVAYSAYNNAIVFGTENEVIAFKLDQESIIKKPKCFIYSLQTKDSTIEIHDGIKEIYIPRSQNTFRLNIGALGFRFREYLEYMYKVNDQEDWLSLKGNKEILFHDLPGGKYVVKVKTLNTVNQLYSDEVSLTINVEKVFYERVWFYFLLAGVSLSVLFLIYRIRINRIIAVERVRSKLSRDLHDDMGSTLSTINILSGIIQTKLETDAKTAKEYVGRISSYSQDMMDSMQDIVWSINPANDSMNKVIVKMREFASNVLEPKNIQFKFTVDGEPDKFTLKMENRRDFFLIFKEAINNAAKYSEADCIEVDLKLKQQLITLLIKDNGKGFDLATVRMGNGLNNIKRRAQYIKAELKIQSLPMAGTQLELLVNL
jgi:ligand-binding sensor domain-containing protein/two-component sensor histidine kinase